MVFLLKTKTDVFWIWYMNNILIMKMKKEFSYVYVKAKKN